MSPASSTATASANPATAVEIDHLPPRWEPEPIRPRLPIGIGILSILIAIAGVVLVLAGLLFLMSESFPALVPVSLNIVHSVTTLGAVILSALGITLLVVATALWRQETWALWTLIVLVFLTEAYLFFIGSISVLFVLFLVLFVYLLAVRRYFY
ncbi:MAG: hypothetical protein WAN87_04570 [Thermoplasmata archaeon]